MGKLDPQLHTEKQAVDAAGLDINHWMKLDQLVRSKDVVFCATGITTGLLFEGVEERNGCYKTQTLMLSGITRERQILTSWLQKQEVDEALNAAAPHPEPETVQEGG